MHIEKLKTSHLPHLQTLLLTCFGDTTSVKKSFDIDFAHFDEKNENVYRLQTLVLLDDNKIIGSVSYSKIDISSNLAGLSWLAVDPDYRKQGIAKNLMLTAEKHILADIFNSQAGTLNIVSGIDPQYYRAIGYADGQMTHSNHFQMSKIITP